MAESASVKPKAALMEVDLAANDEAVLDAVFNPDMPFGARGEIDAKMKQAEQLEAERLEAEAPTIDPEVEAACTKLEGQAIVFAEQGETEKALELFSQAVDLAPTRAAGYNNRAQLYQMLQRPEDALADLDKAVKECQPIPRKVAAQLYAQRAMVQRFFGNDEAARKDFEVAGRNGNEWARKMAVELNPYAAMCNAMLSQAAHTMTEK
eukprot:m.359148 g.359148  ORF g.359148 m.359148 type:complete len:208 (-) comp18450_c0_seq1:250-873(-)